MSFRSWKKDLERKQEVEEVFKSLKYTEKMLQKRRDEYVEKAKNALKEGNQSQYNAYVALLKNAMFNLAQAQDMTTNFIIARDMREMQQISQRFARALNNVMKEVYKTSKSINVAVTQKNFMKAVGKQGDTAYALQTLLEENNVAFANSVNAISDISDMEVKALLEQEIRKDEADFDETLKKLEEEFAVPAPVQTAPPVAVRVGAPAEEPPAPVVRPQPQPRPAPREAELPEDDFPPEPDFPEEPKTDAPEKGKSFDVDNIAFRPHYLKDYMGQDNAVATLSDPIKKARLTGKQLPHILICGSYGQGKTTLAKIISNEMKGNFVTVSAGIKYRDMLRTIRSLKPNDILFVDEVHKLATDVIETLLYPAMEDFEVHVTESVNGHTQAKTVKIAPFTLIGATTETGKLLKPFYSKFPINVTLVDYQLETIASIVKNSFRVTNIAISDELAMEVAKRSRLSPRMANAYVNGIGASAIVKEAERRKLPDGSLNSESTVRALNLVITAADVEEYFRRLGIDELGLKEEERKILRVIIEMYGGGPVGQDNLAKALNMATNRIDQEYEPYLAKLGFINVRPQGRYVTDAAYKYLGLKRGESGQSDVPPEAAPPANSYDETAEEDLPVTECSIGEFNPEAAEWISALFAGNGIWFEQSLDELFAGADKEYDSAAKTRCILKVNGAHELYCDSHLERRFMKNLFTNGFITDARSEALELEYASARMQGKRYFPDFVMKLYDGRVAVVEMKNLSSMGYHLNIDKYESLAAFCREQGYLYAEIARDGESRHYVSAEQLKGMPVNTALAAFIRGKIEENGICSQSDLLEFGYDVKELITVLLNDRSLKNIDRTGANPQIVSAEE